MNIKTAEENTKHMTTALKMLNENNAACLLIVGQTKDCVFHISSNLEENDLLNLIEDIKHVITTTNSVDVDYKKES